MFAYSGFWPATDLRNPHQERLLRIRVPFASDGLLATPRTHTPGQKRSAASVCFSYSITASARSNMERGKVMPSFLAVLTLRISWAFVACCTGISEGFSPLRMRPV